MISPPSGGVARSGVANFVDDKNSCDSSYSNSSSTDDTNSFADITEVKVRCLHVRDFNTKARNKPKNKNKASN